MPTTTAKFGWNKPTVGGDSGAWGGYLNGNLDAQDGTIGALLSASGNLITPGGVAVSQTAWVGVGIRATFIGAIYTDSSSNGTVSTVYIDAHKASTIAATNTVTYTNAYGAYFESPNAGTNVTYTNKWALGADSLQVNGTTGIAGTATIGTLAVTGNTSLTGTLSVTGTETASAYNTINGTTTFSGNGTQALFTIANAGVNGGTAGIGYEVYVGSSGPFQNKVSVGCSGGVCNILASTSNGSVTFSMAIGSNTLQATNSNSGGNVLTWVAKRVSL